MKSISFKCILSVLLFTNLATFAVLAQNSSESRNTDPLYSVKEKQHTDPTQTVLEIDDGIFLGYGAFYWGGIVLDGHMQPASGLRGGWIMNEQWVIGLDFFTLVSNYHPYDDKTKADLIQTFSTWGALIEHIPNPRKRFHVNYSLTIGRGSTSFELDDVNNLAFPQYKESRLFYFLAPEISYEMNFTKYTKPFVGVKAMLPFAGDGNSEIDEQDLLSATVYLGIKVGNFTL